MRVGIIGFARSGKTTLFNALTGAKAEVGAFGAREANVAVLKVPDERVERLSEIFKPKKKTYAEFQLVDVAPAEGSEKALDEAALKSLKQVDALVHVVRCFENDDVMHPRDTIDPVRDCNALEEEMQFDDLVIVERRMERKAKSNDLDLEYKLLERCKEHLEAGQPLRTLAMNPQESKTVAGFTFLSQKPLMLAGNYDDGKIGADDPSGLAAFAKERGMTLIALCGAMEMEVSQLSDEERGPFREELGLGEESRHQFLQMAYDHLGLMSFLTAGEPEVRAWTIPKNTRAQDAAGAIHSDIQRGFIRAEIVHYDHFIAAGTMAKAKEAGHVRLEGKEYIMQDGDIVLFRFNV